MLQILASSFMAATRTVSESERDYDARAQQRTRCRRAIEEDGYAAAIVRGACPE